MIHRMHPFPDLIPLYDKMKVETMCIGRKYRVSSAIIVFLLYIQYNFQIQLQQNKKSFISTSYQNKGFIRVNCCIYC